MTHILPLFTFAYFVFVVVVVRMRCINLSLSMLFILYLFYSVHLCLNERLFLFQFLENLGRKFSSKLWVEPQLKNMTSNEANTDVDGGQNNLARMQSAAFAEPDLEYDDDVGSLVAEQGKQLFIAK